MTKQTQRKRIHYRIRKDIKGTPVIPRLSVFRSNKDIYCQLVDDVTGVTLASASSNDDSVNGATKIEQAKQVGALIASKAKDLNISKAVFDRSGYLYHGRVKAMAEGARENGLNI